MNMNYCKFENTCTDLQQCLESMQDREELSEDEQYAKGRLIAMCEYIVALVKEN